MTLTQMNYIITISETGSLNKAAEALYSFSAVSDKCSEGTGKGTWHYHI